MIDENVWYTDGAEMTDAARDWILGRDEYEEPAWFPERALRENDAQRGESWNPIESPTGAVLFPGRLLALLAMITTEDHDGHVELAVDHESSGDVLMWIRGNAYTLAPTAL